MNVSVRPTVTNMCVLYHAFISSCRVPLLKSRWQNTNEQFLAFSFSHVKHTWNTHTCVHIFNDNDTTKHTHLCRLWLKWITRKVLLQLYIVCWLLRWIRTRQNGRTNKNAPCISFSSHIPLFRPLTFSLSF